MAGTLSLSAIVVLFTGTDDILYYRSRRDEVFTRPLPTLSIDKVAHAIILLPECGANADSPTRLTLTLFSQPYFTAFIFVLAVLFLSRFIDRHAYL